MGVRRGSDEMMLLWRAQGKCCAVCGDAMVPASIYHPTRGWTIEHVYPRSSKRYYADGNKLVSHSQCNWRKGDRQPTGCEVLLLHVVNEILGLELVEYPRCYIDTRIFPTALEIAFQREMAA